MCSLDLPLQINPPRKRPHRRSSTSSRPSKKASTSMTGRGFAAFGFASRNMFHVKHAVVSQFEILAHISRR
jgi:hypothetical protein